MYDYRTCPGYRHTSSIYQLWRNFTHHFLGYVVHPDQARCRPADGVEVNEEQVFRTVFLFLILRP